MTAGKGAQKACQKAAGVLWRVATDSDKAKLEVAKAGAVAPAVALLQAAQQDLSVAAAATEVYMLLCPCILGVSLVGISYILAHYAYGLCSGGDVCERDACAGCATFKPTFYGCPNKELILLMLTSLKECD